MTREEALEELATYKLRLSMLFVAVASVSCEFPITAVTKALGLQPGELARALDNQAIIQAQSDYLSAVENATKGQWGESVVTTNDDFGFGEGEVIISDYI